MRRVPSHLLILAICWAVCGCLHHASSIDGGVEVSIVGRVQRPGTYYFPRGANIEDGIERAGGVRDPEFLALIVVVTHANRPLESKNVMEKFWKTTILTDGDTVRIPLNGY
jgi:protein involved in polysaccharide export with SLBB domain